MGAMAVGLAHAAWLSLRVTRPLSVIKSVITEGESFALAIGKIGVKVPSQTRLWC